MSNNKTIVQINSFNFGSTGNIMLNISNEIRKSNMNAFVAYPKSKSNLKKNVANSITISNRVERNIHLKLAYYTGYNGLFSKLGTRRFIKKLDKIKPDIIHLHNLHNCFINLKLLFNYLKKNNIPVVWTLHDCWAFTGQCPYFTIVQCDKWKKGCYSCPQYRSYPGSRIDRTKEMYEIKKSLFTGVNNLQIVTPSKWLADKVKESFLKEYSVNVINNGIDLDIFKPTKTDFREKYNLANKIILLGVANPWSKRKGLSVFIDLSKVLDDKYKIVLVGLNYEQMDKLPENILGLPRTSDARKLAGIYTGADYFINPSLEETMGLVTVESLACGTPAIVSNSTAVPEMVDTSCGIIVDDSSSEGFYKAIVNETYNFDKQDCINHARKFDKTLKFSKYIDIYKRILN